MTKAIFVAALCAGLLAAPVPVLTQTAEAQMQSPAPAKAETTKAKKEPSAGTLAMRERQKKCGAEWKEAKAAGKIEKGMTWPKYWSACNKRLKSAS